MKRTLFILLAALTLFCLCTAAFAEQAGTATKVEGRADILRSGQARAIDLKTGDAVNVGDIVRTLSNGRVEITFVDNSTINLGPRGRLGIDTYLFRPSEEKRTVDLKLYRGRMGFNVPKAVYAGSGSKFEMRTRTAVAGVRGTGGLLISGLISRCYTTGGLLWFGNPMGSVMVGVGQVASAQLGLMPTVRPFTPGEFNRENRLLTTGGGSQGGAGGSGAPASGSNNAPPENSLFSNNVLLSQQLDIPVTSILPPPPTLPERWVPSIGSVGSLGQTFLAPMNIDPSSTVNQLTWWYDSMYHGNAALINQVGVQGQMNFTTPDTGLYQFAHAGRYTVTASGAMGFPGYDDSLMYIYTGPVFINDPSTGRGVNASLFGGVGADLYGSSRVINTMAGSTGQGGEFGAIYDGTGRTFWYAGVPLAGGTYNTIFKDSNTPLIPLNGTGNFAFSTTGFFWDGSKPIWEAYNALPTKPAYVMDVLLPITSVVSRVFDLSGSGSLHVLAPGHVVRGDLNVNLIGKGAETAPGTGIFDLKMSGNWTITGGSTLQQMSTFSGSMNIGGSTLYVNPDESRISPTMGGANAFMMLYYPSLSPTSKTFGIAAGAMTGTTSGTIDGRAIGKMCNGFILGGACP